MSEPTRTAADSDGLPDGFSEELRRAAGLDHPRQIGHFQILELIGTGGFGEVYKAERRSPMRQLVAIKVIKLGYDTREIIARFESERQALARMDHPHIAKVLDAGTTDSGRPYFVMEYVAGLPMTKFADDNKLTIKDRLLLFTQVCEAIAHAHTKAIIHRDIKASNVLAYLHDGKPTAKVIDFGIAKALTGDRLTEKTFNTDRGVAIGTYETMSPEQAEGSPDIDTRTDVYSLGVLLYELLTGAKPFNPDTFARVADHEIRRIIREVEPPRPSTRLSALGEVAPRVAALRRQQLDALTRELRGELEWIPLKAMRKERDRRYVSAHQIAEDIQNYLEHHPLIAGPESRSYRLRKYLKRNRGPVAAVTVVVLTVTLGVIVATAMFIRAERNKRQAIEFLSELVAKTNETALSQWGRGELPPAESELRLALTRAGRDLGPNDPITLRLMHNLASWLQLQGKTSEAIAMYRDTLARRRDALGSDDRETLISMNSLGAMLRDQKQYPEAEQLLREALDRRRRVFTSDHPDTLVSMHDLGSLLWAQGKATDAEPLLREVLDRRRRVLGDSHIYTLGSLNFLGRFYQRSGRFADAEPLFAELYRNVPSAQIPTTTANIYMARWGTCLVQLARYSEAEAPLKEAYERLSAGQRESIAIREVVGAMVEMYEKTGRPDEAARWRAELAALEAATQPTTVPR